MWGMTMGGNTGGDEKNGFWITESFRADLGFKLTIKAYEANGNYGTTGFGISWLISAGSPNQEFGVPYAYEGLADPLHCITHLWDRGIFLWHNFESAASGSPNFADGAATPGRIPQSNPGTDTSLSYNPATKECTYSIALTPPNETVFPCHQIEEKFSGRKVIIGVASPNTGNPSVGNLMFIDAIELRVNSVEEGSAVASLFSQPWFRITAISVGVVVAIIVVASSVLYLRRSQERKAMAMVTQNMTMDDRNGGNTNMIETPPIQETNHYSQATAYTRGGGGGGLDEEEYNDQSEFIPQQQEEEIPAIPGQRKTTATDVRNMRGTISPAINNRPQNASPYETESGIFTKIRKSIFGPKAVDRPGTLNPRISHLDDQTVVNINSPPERKKGERKKSRSRGGSRSRSRTRSRSRSKDSGDKRTRSRSRSRSREKSSNRSTRSHSKSRG